MTTKIIIIIVALAMTGSAVADQPRLPPKPTPTKTFQKYASTPSIPIPEEMAPECQRLEKVYFAGIDAVEQDDAGQHLTYVNF